MAIGVDVGGTTTRVAKVDASGLVISSRRGPTGLDAVALLRWIAECVHDVIAESASKGSKADCIGVALPGIVDRTKRELVRSVNLPALEGRQFADELEEVVGLPVALMTDAEAATWGEYAAGRRHRGCFAHIRLGTGIACGIVRDGRLIPADPTRKTHWESLVVDRSPEALKCPCGLRGCLELFASGRALEEQARAIGLREGIVGLQAAFAAGHAESGEIVRATARAVCMAIGNLAGEFGMETVLIGGGVIERMPCLLGEVEMAIESGRDECFGTARLTTGRSRLGDDAGVIGAALLARASTTDP